MIIKTEIIDSFLEHGNLDSVKDHWIYHSIVPGQYTFEEPLYVNKELLVHLYETIQNRLYNFKPLNEALWHQVFGDMQIPDTTAIYLIAGSPKPYDGVVREDQSGMRCIILDLVRLCTYADSLEELDFIAADFLTHELSHVLMSQRYPYSKHLPKVNVLKQLVFDEGIAHFLSYKEDVLSLDWHTDKMNNRRESVYQKLRYYLTQEYALTPEAFSKANTGSFWDKYASISGMFAVISYCEQGGKLEELLDKGPNALLEIIEKGI